MISEHLANLKRLAVAGKQLPWCIDAGLIKEWGGRIARFNSAGWLPIEYAACLGIGGRNGLEIAPGVVLQANHLGFTQGQAYYSLGADGKLRARTMVRGAKLPSYDISVAIVDSTDNGGAKVAPLAPVGFTVPNGTPVVMSDSGDSIKNAIVAAISDSTDPWLSYRSHAGYSSFWIASAAGDSSGGVILLTNAGPVTLGVRQKSSAFIDCCDPKVRAEIDATIAKLKPEAEVLTSNNPPLSVDNIILGQNPYAYLPLGDVNGTTATAMNPTTYTGTYTGGYTLDVAGGVNRDSSRAVTLNGSTGYVNTGTLGSLGSLQASGISVQCRIRTTQTGVAAVWGHSSATFSPAIFLVLNQNSSGSAATGRIRFYLADSSNVKMSKAFNSASSVNDGNWHTVAWVMSPNSGTGSIFLDGVSLSLTNGDTGSPSNHANFARDTYLGGLNLNGTLNSPLNGSLQKFSIFNRALTLAEHQAFHLACVNGAFGSIAGQIG
jgi:hypothetical protein